MTASRPRPMHNTHHPARPTLRLVEAPPPVSTPEPRTRAGRILVAVVNLHGRIPFVLRAWTYGNAVALIGAAFTPFP